MQAKTLRQIRSNANPHIVSIFVVSNILLLFAIGCFASREWGPAVVTAGIPTAAGVAWLFSAYRAKKYRLRLLADGVRVTDWGRTRTLCNPELLHMERIRNGMIELRAEGETLDIDLEHFEWRDQAILLEHLGQFLTPEQQTKHGRRWSQLYAERITVPKPKRIDAREQFLSIWRLGCIVAGCCILFAPLLLELSVRGEGFTLAQIPEMREMLYTMLIVCSLGPLGLLSVFGMLMIPAFYHKHIQRVGIGAMVKVGWLVKESQIRQLFWKYGISRCLPHNL